MTSFLPGFYLGFSLILAIGAQNAFVLRQGLMRSHVFWVCLTCALSDALLISAGVAGFGALAEAVPWLETVMRWFGAAFLLWYGWRNAVSAWRGGQALDAAAPAVRQSAQLAGAGRADCADHVGDCGHADLDVTLTRAVARLPAPW